MFKVIRKRYRLQPVETIEFTATVLENLFILMIKPGSAATTTTQKGFFRIR
jgi:hypothetical protein